VAVNLVPLRAAAGPAPHLSGDPVRSHHDATTTPPDATTLLWWRQDLHFPHIVGDIIYGSLCSDGGSCWLTAVDRVTGADLWIAPIEGEVIGVTPDIIVAWHNDRLFALTIDTRREAWSTPIERFGGRAALHEANLYVSWPDGIVVALNPATGATRWQATVSGIPEGGKLNELTVTPDALLLTISEAAYARVPTSVIALSNQDGAELWRTTDEDGRYVHIVAVGIEDAYVTTGAGRLVTAFSLGDGTVRWTATASIGTSFMSAAVNGSTVLVSESRGSDPESSASLIAFDTLTGAQGWRFAVGGASASTPIVQDGVVYAAATGGDLVYAVDVATGTQRWSRPVGSGRVLAVTVDMVLVEGDALYALLPT